MKEPEFTRTINSPKYEIPDLETKTKVREFVIEDKSIFKPTQEGKAPVLDEEPPVVESGSKSSSQEPEENVNVTAAAVVQEEPEQGVTVSSRKEQENIQPVYQQSYKLRDFVLIEDQYETAGNPPNEEKITTIAIPLAEHEPVLFDVDPYQSQTRNVRPEKPLKDEGDSEQSNAFFRAISRLSRAR